MVIAGAAALLRADRGAAAGAPPAGPALGRRRWSPSPASRSLLAAAGLVVGGLREKPSAAELSAANAGRLISVSSNRYDYWRVGARAFVDHPLEGLG